MGALGIGEQVAPEHRLDARRGRRVHRLVEVGHQP